MGKQNKARRAAKARARRSPPGGWARAQWRPFDHAHERPPITESELAAELLRMAAELRHRGDRDEHTASDELARLDPTIVHRAAERLLLDLVARLWADGWQPAELLRQGRRALSTGGSRLVALTVAVDNADRRASTLDRRWAAQVESLDLPPADGRSGWVRRRANEEGDRGADGLSLLVDVLAAMTILPKLELLLPPPGSAEARDRRRSAGGPEPTAMSDPILAKVRALLAKAESTEFEAEATAFTAKAQELMTRHAVDAAMVQGAGRRDGEAPVVIRVPVDAPYADIKSLLLQTVADAGRCRSVFLDGLAMSSVIGFAADLAAVELLFTSLLLQAQTALADAARTAPAGTRTRSQRYRSAFLVAYTHRIGDRLAEINDAVYAEAEAERGASFLPVLRSRAEAVDDVMAERFSTVSRSRVRGGYDAAGWASGRLAADHARLGSGEVAAQA